MAIDGKIEIRPMMYLALSYDHRLVDGREAVTFLVRVKEDLKIRSACCWISRFPPSCPALCRASTSYIPEDVDGRDSPSMTIESSE